MKAGAGAGDDPAIEPLGETALLLRFGTSIDAALNARVHEASQMLRSAHLPGILDIVPAYATLALRYEPSLWTDGHETSPWRNIAAAVRAIFRTPPAGTTSESAIVDVPVCYGGEFGPDLDVLARHAGFDAAEVVARHVAADYHVAMIGFAPGFPYLLGLDPALHMPRRASPRTRVPAGSVAVGGAQTGIYPSASPGGWQLIGRTPAVLFDAQRMPPCLLAPGDRVRFVAIDAAEFAERSRT